MNINNKKILLIGALSLTISACSQENKTEEAAKENAVEAAEEKTLAETSEATAAGETISSGTFTGRSDHVMSGGASIVKTDEGYKLVLADDFSLDGAPAPVVALVNDETYDAANKVAALESISGSQTYDLPADFSPDAFSEVMVYCEQASAPLGVAPLAAN